MYRIHLIPIRFIALVLITMCVYSPNLITMSGLLCVMVNLATLLYYSPDLGTCPNWVYYS